MHAKTNPTKKDLIVILGCVIFLLLNFSAVDYQGRERVKIIVCQTNLKKIGQAQFLYLDDNDDCYPNPWTSLFSTEMPVPGYQRYCRWHDPRYPADGPLFIPYIEEDKIILCPTFKTLGKHLGQNHPGHDPSISVEPYYSYSMNVFLGSRSTYMYDGIIKRSEITRSKAEVFFFA